MDITISLISGGGGALGASLGSFLAACFDRKERGLTPSDPPRSECPGCHRQLTALENIPLLSYLWVQGKCVTCGWRIPAWYFYFELVGGMVGFIAGALLAAYGSRFF